MFGFGKSDEKKSGGDESKEQREEGLKMAASEGEAVQPETPETTEQTPMVKDNTPSDTPFTLAELREQKKENQWYTPLAHRLLKQLRVDFNQNLRNTVMRPRFQNLQRQLTHEEVKDAYKFWQERPKKQRAEILEKQAKNRELQDRRVDDSYTEAEKVACVVCQDEYQPMRLNLVKDGKRYIDEVTGLEKVIGNFMVAAVEGQPTVNAVCQNCFRTIGGESYTYGDACAVRDQAISEIKAEADKAARARALRDSLTGPNGKKVRPSVTPDARYYDSHKQKRDREQRRR